MTPHRFVQLDVFTNVPFGGNQLAVLPSAAGLNDAQMQAIAREMNFSETTFVLPPADAAHDARVRIFTPGSELPMAGHPTVGTGFLLGSERGRTALTLELGIGPVVVHVDPGDGMHGAATMTQPLPVFRSPGLRADEAAALASLDAARLHPDLPVLRGSAGVEYVYVPVRSRADVAAAAANATAMARAFENDTHKAVYVFSVEPSDASDVRGRMFFLVNGAAVEDPATGSAAGPLGAYLVVHGAARPGRIRLQQGYEMGRPSDIAIDVECGATGDLTGVRVGGGVVKVADGMLFA